eukprot:4718861-Pleurochrysis_carterae.AAC.2
MVAANITDDREDLFTAVWHMLGEGDEPRLGLGEKTACALARVVAKLVLQCNWSEAVKSYVQQSRV